MEKTPLYTIGSISLILISITLIFTFVLPKYKDFTALQKEISLKKMELEAQRKYFQELKKVAEDLKEYKDVLSKIDFALPSEPCLIDFLNFLQRITPQSGIALTGISVSQASSIGGNEEGKEEIKESRISLGLNGDYVHLKNFLSILENSARIIEIESLSFSSPEKDIPFGFNLTLKVYSY